MKFLLFALSFLFIACTGSLTSDQRKKIKENMEQGEIKKVTDVQITEAAFDYGRKIATEILAYDRAFTNLPLQDSLSQLYGVELVSIHESNKSLRAVEKQLLEAYTAQGSNIDNVQKMGSDSLLYTKPLMREHPDGSTEFTKAIGIRMTRKQIILSIKE
ncbi:MAG: hypothetical protein IPK96_02615 [Flammeovirgaceae bacterium]|jgi:hypothetical protein|nr:hypothetical protein [Flammeovirgaceae bacterium]